MADITVTAADVRLIDGPVRDFDAGGAGTLGEPVYLASDGDVEVADADAAASAQAVGIVVAAPNGGTSYAAGDRLAVALPGAIVTGYSGLTPGALLYASTNAGEIADAAPAGASGDYKWIIARAVSATTIRVECWTDDVAAQ